jgi:hypothetical protein
MATHAFTTSDLARRRKDVLAAARTGTAMIRDTDGFVLAILPADRLAVTDRLADLNGTLRCLVATLNDPSPAPAALGEAAWASTWAPSRRQQLAADLAEALALAESLGDPGPAAGLLEASRPQPRAGKPFDATAAFKSLSEEGQAVLRGERRSPLEVQ